MIDTVFAFSLFVLSALFLSIGIKKLTDIYEDTKREKQNGK